MLPVPTTKLVAADPDAIVRFTSGSERSTVSLALQVRAAAFAELAKPKTANIATINKPNTLNFKCVGKLIFNFFIFILFFELH